MSNVQVDNRINSILNETYDKLYCFVFYIFSYDTSSPQKYSLQSTTNIFYNRSYIFLMGVHLKSIF